MTATEGYKPDTHNDVRELYAMGKLEWEGARPDEGRAEFDRWLAEHDAETRHKALEEAEAAVRPVGNTYPRGWQAHLALREAADRIHLLIESETRP